MLWTFKWNVILWQDLELKSADWFAYVISITLPVHGWGEVKTLKAIIHKKYDL